MLERHIEVRQYLALGHQRDQVVDARIGVNIMHAHPDTEFGKRLAKFAQAGFDRPAAKKTHTIFDINAIGAGVLRDHQQFANARLGQISGFLQNIANRPADQRSAHRRDDAEGAAMIAAFGNFQVGKMLRRQFDALRRNKAGIGVMRLRQVGMNMVQHLIGCVRPGNRQDLRMCAADQILLGAEATGDDHLTIFCQGFTDCIKRLLDGRIDEAASVHNHQIGAFIRGRDKVAFCT